ncbi:MAG: hypothetical protein DCC58_18720 [Chloroflexi bacterium]|nr:MAG: hypothetical protein DCC58_18720 [Chloroflexota bacterium]
MVNGDLAFILAFIVLPTAILVSSIWFYVLIRKGIMLPPRAQRPADDADVWQLAVEKAPADASEAEPLVVTQTTAWGNAPAPADDPVGATLEHPIVATPHPTAEPAQSDVVVVTEAPAQALDELPGISEPAASPPTTEAISPELEPEAEPVVAETVPQPDAAPITPTVALDTQFLGYEQTHELPLIVPPATETPAAPEVDMARNDDPPVAEATPQQPAQPPPAAAPGAVQRRKPARRLGPREPEDEPLRRLSASRRGSARKGEAAVERSDSPANIRAADHE